MTPPGVPVPTQLPWGAYTAAVLVAIHVSLSLEEAPSWCRANSMRPREAEGGNGVDGLQRERSTMIETRPPCMHPSTEAVSEQDLEKGHVQFGSKLCSCEFPSEAATR